MLPKPSPSCRVQLERSAGTPGPWRERARRLLVGSGDRHPKRQSGNVESLRVCAPTRAHKCRRTDMADTSSQPQNQWQRDAEVSKQDRSPQGATLSHILDSESLNKFLCSFHIPLNGRSYPSDAANCSKRDVWAIKTSKIGQTKTIVSVIWQLLNFQRCVWAPPVKLLILTVS